MIAKIIKQMIHYEQGNSHTIEHFLKVYSYAKTIGELEMIDLKTQYILELAAVLHDVGIQESIKKYGSKAGTYQEELGPAIACEMLLEHHEKQSVIDRVCYLIGHHHSYQKIAGIDFQILVEADFLVNFAEGNIDIKTLASVKKNIFKTTTGLYFLEIIYEK